MNIVWRRYEAADHDAVVELHITALAEMGAYFEASPELDADLDDIETVYLHDGEFLVGTLSGRIVAMGALLSIDTDTAVLKRMRVHRDYQRQGLGTEVLGRLERRARDLGKTRLVLDTSTVQHSALSFYAKMGYNETCRQIATRGTKTLELVYFEKHLA